MIEEQQRVDYYTYIKSQGWYKRRWGALQRASHACQVCKSTTQLEVHHNSYANLGDEKASDLIVLCGGPEGCHSLFHKHRKLVQP